MSGNKEAGIRAEDKKDREVESDFGLDVEKVYAIGILCQTGQITFKQRIKMLNDLRPATAEHPEALGKMVAAHHCAVVHGADNEGNPHFARAIKHANGKLARFDSI